MSDDADLDQLREATDHGDRLDEAAGADVYEDLRESMVEYLEEIDDGGRQKTVSVWDGDIAALMAALEDHPEHLQAYGEALREELDLGGTEPPDRSEVLRLALRLGLREAAPDDMETARKANQDHATRGL
ncbi:MULTISPECIES: hypothetical protein [Haloarcula]|uniref:hypothetical protein n=1 Tax=Haloarcula TaxID=2237 RepID=UPI000F8E731F|nr:MULTISPECIES: hypothetical protein [Haloarcula]NHX42010.1 hypothetical protein [Haloarcula sp. R1-2]